MPGSLVPGCAGLFMNIARKHETGMPEPYARSQNAGNSGFCIYVRNSGSNQDPESSGWRVSLFYALRLFGHVLKLSRRRIERHHDPILRHGRGAHHDLIDTPLQPAQFFIRDDPAEPDVALRLP